MGKITRAEYNALKEKVELLEQYLNGGKGSGNFGHKGRPGKVGGSGKSGSVSSKDSSGSEKIEKSERDSYIEAIKGNKWTKKFVEGEKADEWETADLRGLAEIARTGEISYDSVMKMPAIKKMADYVNSTKQLNPAENKELVDKTEQQFLDTITKQAEARGGIKNERKAFIITGLPGAGKTSNGLGDKLNNGYLEFDNDIAKGVPALSEYFAGGKGANTVQEVSSAAQTQALQKIMKNGTNIAWPAVGKNKAKLEKQIRMLHNAGYEVEIACVDASLNTALARTTTRFLETGRFVGPDYVKSCTTDGNSPIKAYNDLKKTGLTDDDGKKINIKFSGVKNA